MSHQQKHTNPGRDIVCTQGSNYLIVSSCISIVISGFPTTIRLPTDIVLPTDKLHRIPLSQLVNYFSCRCIYLAEGNCLVACQGSITHLLTLVQLYTTRIGLLETPEIIQNVARQSRQTLKTAKTRFVKSGWSDKPLTQELSGHVNNLFLS